MLKYHVKQKYARDPDERTIALFDDLNDAKEFILKMKLPLAVSLKNQVVYTIYRGGFDLIEQFNAEEAAASPSSSSSESQSPASGSKPPSPFSTRPTLPGMANKWQRYDDDDEEKK